MRFRSAGFSVESEMQFLAKHAKLRVMEVPITACYFDQPKRSVVAHGLLVIKGLLNLSVRYTPSRFFGLFGSVMLVISFLLPFRFIDAYVESPILVLGFTLCRFFLFIIGLLGLFAAMLLHPIRVWFSDLHRLVSEQQNDATQGSPPHP